MKITSLLLAILLLPTYAVADGLATSICVFPRVRGVAGGF